MNTEQLAEVLQNKAWAQLYKDRYYSDPTAQAQDQLTGRTHYVDPDTLRFHHSRILRARPICSGLFFRIVESCSADYQNTRRVFRYVVFDVWGEIIARPDLEGGFSSTDKALKGFDDWLAGFDPVEYYRAKLAEKIKLTQAEAGRLETALNEIALTLLKTA